MLSHHTVEWIRWVRSQGPCWSGVAQRFHKHLIGSGLVSLPGDQDTALSYSTMPGCSHAPGHNDNGLSLWDCKPAPVKCLLRLALVTVSLHSNRTVTETLSKLPNSKKGSVHTPRQDVWCILSKWVNAGLEKWLSCSSRGVGLNSQYPYDG